MQSYLEKHNAVKNEARFYSLIVMPDLFGEWTLYREWVRIGQSGKTRLESFATEEDGRSALAVIDAAKRRRGYWLRPEQLPLLLRDVTGTTGRFTRNV